MEANLEFRWLTNEEIETFVNPVLRQRGWAELNINEAQPTCRVLGAIEGGASIVGFICLQMHPVIGPEWVDAFHRNGALSRHLAELMGDFLKEVHARGALTICESPVTERLAQRHGMQRIDFPVYQWIGE